MPKLPDDMSDEAIKRRALMSAESRTVQTKPGRLIPSAELEELRQAAAKSLGLDPSQVTGFFCRRGKQ